MKDASIILTRDGSHSLASETFDTTYHSIHGAIQESQHIFINAAFRMKAVAQQELSILELGFGTGLNAYLSYLEAKRRGVAVAYTAIEAYPISLQQASQLNYPELLQRKPKAFLKLHQIHWEQEKKLHRLFKIEKLKSDFQQIDYENHFDIVYFDAFAPDIQPELWSPEVLEKTYRALKPDGFLVTYCAKGIVKRRLKAIGFLVEALKGPPGKREMTRAVKVSS